MIIFIVNPVAGSGKGNRAAPIIESVMKASGRDYRVVYTTKPRDTETIAEVLRPEKPEAVCFKKPEAVCFKKPEAVCFKKPEAVCFKKPEAVICVGGDGTLQEIAPKLLYSGIPMGIIPAGSGNDFVASLPGFKILKGGFEQKIAAYTKRLLVSEVKTIDAISVRGFLEDGDSPEESICLNIGSTGIDAETAASTLRIKKFFGGAAYFVSLLKTLFTYKSQNIAITADGKRTEGRRLLAAICNGSFYGGGFNICPSAKIDDGFITLCDVTHMIRPKVAVLFPSVLFGGHTKFREVSQTNCRELLLEFDGSRLINLDGNMFRYKSPIEFKILQGALKILA